MLRLDLCDYSDAYIIVKRRRTVRNTNPNNQANKMLILKNNAPFMPWISKINNTFIDNAENLDTVMPIHNVLECNDSFPMTLGSLRNYYGHEVNDDANENNAGNAFWVSNEKTTTSKSFEYKTKTVWSGEADNNRLDKELVSYSIKIFE